MEISFDQFLKTVSENIRKERKRRKLVQKDMIKKGLGLRHYQDIESGRANLTLSTLWKIANAFDISINSLLRTPDEVARREIDAETLYSLIQMLPFGLILWERTNPKDPNSIVLSNFNPRAEQLTIPNLAGRLGDKLSDIFPNTPRMGFSDVFNRVLDSQEQIKLDNFAYHDVEMKLGHFNLWCIPLCNDRLAVLFENTTEQHYHEQFKIVHSTLKPPRILNNKKE